MRVDSRLELVVQLDIAKRLGTTKQRVAQLAARDSFPSPLGVLGRSTADVGRRRRGEEARWNWKR